MILASALLAGLIWASPVDVGAGSVDGWIELSYDPTTRDEAIWRLRSHLERAPDDERARHALARALAWSGHLDDALGHYDRLQMHAEGERAQQLQRERLEILAWKGETRTATRGYRALVDEDPQDVDARIGLARSLRWRGRPLAGRWHVRRAQDLDPGRADVREELAWSYAAVGLRHGAKRALGEGPPSDELGERLRRIGRSSTGAMVAASGNSFGIHRIAPRARTRIRLPFDLDLHLGAGATWLQQDTEEQTRGVAGAAFVAAVERLELRVGAGVHAATGYAAPDGHAVVTVHALDELHLSVGYRRHPLLESALPEAIDESAYHTAGVGGAQVLAEAIAVDLDRLDIGLDVLPAPWIYAYGRGTRLWVDDGNRGFTVSTGTGVDVFGYWARWPVRLFARWDIYMAGFDETSTAYFAPGFLDVHSVGPELRVSAWKLTASAAAGGTFPLVAFGARGYFAGGGLDLHWDRVSLGLRGDYRADAFYDQWRGWLSFDVAY
jgi:hypothetical protein